MLFHSGCLLLPIWVSPTLIQLVKLTHVVTANDGHDTSVTTAGAWARDFLTPLLTNSNFLNNTLVLLSRSSVMYLKCSLLTFGKLLTKLRVILAITKYSRSSLVMQYQQVLRALPTQIHTLITLKWQPWRITGVWAIWDWMTPALLHFSSWGLLNDIRYLQI